MEALVILCFVLGYLAIIFEHSLKLDKTVSALIMASTLWALLAIGFHNGWYTIVDSEQQTFNYLLDGDRAEDIFNSALLHHLGTSAEIMVFLICAMTIVELIDIHRGFTVVHHFIETRYRTHLLWMVGGISFVLSATIDNLTTTIIVITLLRKLVPNKERRWWYIGLAVIAANAGGAWSPIGDVTTTMLWLSDKVSVIGLAKYLFIPSLVCFLVPFVIATFLPVFRGVRDVGAIEAALPPELLSSKMMLFLGVSAIVAVPIFKTVTHLPPYLGIMAGLGFVWLVSDLSRPENHMSRERHAIYSAKRALRHIEMSSILFFLGILMSVGVLETLVYGSVNGQTVGTLRYLAESLGNRIPNQDVLVMMLGVFSAIIDNVPLVAASIGMFTEALDAKLWHFIAYAAGTGGSMLLIGSAAGVTAMGMEDIEFNWYLKKISPLAIIGFVCGAATFLILFPLFV